MTVLATILFKVRFLCTTSECATKLVHNFIADSYKQIHNRTLESRQVLLERRETNTKLNMSFMSVIYFRMSLAMQGSVFIFGTKLDGWSFYLSCFYLVTSYLMNIWLLSCSSDYRILEKQE